MWGKVASALPALVQSGGRLLSRQASKTAVASVGKRMPAALSSSRRMASRMMKHKPRTKGPIPAATKTSKFGALKAKLGKYYDKLPESVKGIGSYVATSFVIDTITDLIMDPDNDDTASDEDANLISDLISVANGTSVLKYEKINPMSNSLSGPSVYDQVNLVSNMMKDANVIMGQEQSFDDSSRLHSLTEQDKIHIIGVLSNISKRIAVSCPNSAIVNLFRIQSNVSSDLCSYPTNAMSALLADNNSQMLSEANHLAGSYAVLFESLSEDLREDSIQDYFDRNTELVGEDYTGRKEGLVPFTLPNLAVGSANAESLGTWSKFKIDEGDVSDDEYMVGRDISDSVKLSDSYAAFLQRSVRRTLGFETKPVI